MNIHTLLLSIFIVSIQTSSLQTTASQTSIPKYYLNDENFKLISENEKKSLAGLFAKAKELHAAQQLKAKLNPKINSAVKQPLKKINK